MSVQMNKEKSYITPSGEPIAEVFERVFDEKTRTTFVKKTKDFDVYEFIQSSNSKTDLALLRAQMIETGQIPSVSDEVVDASLFPENIHDLFGVVNSIDDRFNKLPDSIKVVFGSKDKFLSALVGGTYEQEIVDYYKKVASSVDKTAGGQPDKVEEGDE